MAGSSPHARAIAFRERFGPRVPMLLAPPARIEPVGSLIAVVQAGGLSWMLARAGQLPSPITPPRTVQRWTQAEAPS